MITTKSEIYVEIWLESDFGWICNNSQILGRAGAKFSTASHVCTIKVVIYDSCLLCFLNVGYRTEIKQGAEILAEKIKKYRPKIAVFNGKGKLDFLRIYAKYYNACLV